MKKFAKRQSQQNQMSLLIHSLRVLIRSDLVMISWPNSPLLVILQFVDPSVLFGKEDTRFTLLHHLADLADPFNYSTHEIQLILAQQLIEHGANANAAPSPNGKTPLHYACFSGNVTNLDFVEYLLEAGADPNAQDDGGRTPLMYTTTDAPGAAKFLLTWPTTDVNITNRSGESFLFRVRSTITTLSDQIALSDNSYRVQLQFKLQQRRNIKEMLLEMGAIDTGINTLE